METLYIDRKGSELEIQGSRLQVRVPGPQRPFSTPLNLLEFLVISASVQFSSTLLSRLTQEGITAVFLNPRKEEATSIAYGLLHNAAERRLMQYRAISSDSLSLCYSIALVKQKLRGQRAMLQRALRRRPDQRRTLSKGIERLASLEPRLGNVANTSSLRGIEGAGAAMYFEAFQCLFAPRLEFTGRNRRPPRDPVNVILSLTYTLMHAEAIRVLVSIGFDPQLGVYHLPSFGRESLACDLLEMYRPIIEYWIWRLFARETLRLDHFSLSSAPDKPCILGKAGRKEYYQNYEYQARLWRKMLRRTARHWLTRLQNDTLQLSVTERVPGAIT
ncbi:CRISPR-associated endonuclease Cas1 [Marinimicrobium sp. ARAG 43.8]|uniref:CRISPR-associated endonuclease Cas1 n=1 Tax=Marinimicrobium sp. ARAG 43.8 TaxID=3418719 RepID=UPI003CF9DD28